MHGKSYHKEINENVLARHFEDLNDIQAAMEEMAESRKLLVKYDPFLSTMADQLFTHIEHLEIYLSDNSENEVDE